MARREQQIKEIVMEPRGSRQGRSQYLPHRVQGLEPEQLANRPIQLQFKSVTENMPR